MKPHHQFEKPVSRVSGVVRNKTRADMGDGQDRDVSGCMANESMPSPNMDYRENDVSKDGVG
jgi:hypothetical protein